MFAIHCQTVNDCLKIIQEHEVKYVSFRYSDPFGQLQHFVSPTHQLNENTFKQGVPFDGSSVRGWQSINESDMYLIPDPKTAYFDPFSDDLTICLMCKVIDPVTRTDYLKDSRQIAIKTMEYIKSSELADEVFFGPEAEFFVFDNIQYKNQSNLSYYELDSISGSWNTSRNEQPNTGYKIPAKASYFTTPPMDKGHEIRMEMMKVLEETGIVVERGHAEVGSGGQGEINIKFGDLLTSADNLQKFKYVLRNVGNLYEKYVTFLPKPLANDNGSGMHTHLSFWKDGKNLFSGKEYAGLSKTALFAIGGIIKHAGAVAAFTNPTLNSYHRLVPGFEAPVSLTYSKRNRSAAIRIPITTGGEATRIECRFPDASSNPYLAFSALALAALDGIKNQILPASPLEKDLYELDDSLLKKIPKMPKSLEEALNNLSINSEFLTMSGAFTEEFIEMWIDKKQAEINEIRKIPHPKEFELYYDI